MNLKFQQSAVDELTLLAKSDRHSLLIDGPQGSGKSYLAKQYMRFLSVLDYAAVKPTVVSIREALEASYDLSSPVVFCIENLDLGVPAASYTLLKFLEEPTQNVYIVVTCRNRYNVPDTIISRSTCVTVSNPVDSDIADYAEIKDIVKYRHYASTSIWSAVKSLLDVEYVFTLTNDQVAYFDGLLDMLQFKENISTVMWQLGHYSDNSETNIPFVFNYIIANCKSQRVVNYAIQCVKDMTLSHVASHAAIAKFAFECKYGE